LSARVLEIALGLLLADDVGHPVSAQLFGRPFTERDVRLSLEETYRALASRSASRAERVSLVDRANEVRPRSLL
jgi:serine/threonine-protein kinase PknG